MLSRVEVILRQRREISVRVKRELRNDPEDKESCYGFKFWYLPYSGTCPVPLFRRRRTRLPPDLISSMALAWVMSRVLSPLISMIWSPTWMSGSVWQRVNACVLSMQTFFFNVKSKQKLHYMDRGVHRLGSTLGLEWFFRSGLGP